MKARHGPHFDHRSAKRFDRQRASGPFGVDEVLPKKILAWVNRKHPDSGKKQTLLNFTEWQKGQAARIIADFELYAYEWTLTAVKFRESLDKQDRRDLAQSVFARDRDGRLLEAMRQIRGVTLERDDDGAEQAARARADLPAAQQASIDELIAAAEGIREDDRPVISTSIGMMQTEFDLLVELLRVFYQARSHFIYEICEPSVKRFINAQRIRYEEEQNVRMPWADYKATLLDRMQNSSTIDGLLSYVVKPRENDCPIGLWVAERVAERKLLNEDGIDMSEDTWVELTLSFVTNEEKQTLQVPARDRRPEIEGGYGVAQLQRSLAQFDPSTFKPFRQTNCRMRSGCPQGDRNRPADVGREEEAPTQKGGAFDNQAWRQKTGRQETSCLADQGRSAGSSDLCEVCGW